MKPLKVKGTTFGVLLRATRLGYHLSDKHGAFVRIEGEGEIDGTRT